MSTPRRVEQMSSEIHRAVQQVLSRGLQDPRVSGLITVTAVKVSPDLKHATILVSVIPEEKQDLTLHGLKAAERHVRHEVGEIVRTREMPEFSFKLDPTLKREAGVLKELDRVRREREGTGDTGRWGAGGQA